MCGWGQWSSDGVEVFFLPAASGEECKMDVLFCSQNVIDVMFSIDVMSSIGCSARGEMR